MQLLQLKRPSNYSTAPANAIPAGHSSKTKVFIEKARAVHGDRYDYSKTVYVRNRDKVTIICREHGEFEQKPTIHLKGCGCPRCPYRYSETTSLYLLSNGKQVKIGYSIDPDMRLIGLNRAQPFAADLILSWALPDAPTARAAEADIHKQLADYHAGLSGFDGATEWFNTTPLHAQAVIANAIKQVTAQHGGKGGYGYEN